MKSKNRLLILLTFVISFSGNVFCQNISKTDSLQSLIEKYQFDDAIKLANRYLSKDSSNIRILLMKGKAQSSGYMLKDAVETYKKVLVLDPENIINLQELVNTFKNLGAFDSSMVYSKKQTVIQPENSFFKEQLAELYYSNKNFIAAINVLKLLDKPNNFYILKQIGNCYFELENMDSAKVYYTRAGQLFPMDAFVNQKLINTYIKLHDYNMGLEIAEKFLSKDSANTKILKLKAYCYYLLKNYSDAERWFLKCNEKGDSSLFCYRYTALSFFMQEKYDTAVKYFLKAFEIDTSDAEMAYYIGTSAYKSYNTNTDTGVYYFNKAVALEKHHLQFLSIVYSEMAEAYNNIFQSDTALYMLRRAHEIDPLKKSILFKTAYQYDYWLKNK